MSRTGSPKLQRKKYLRSTTTKCPPSYASRKECCSSEYSARSEQRSARGPLSFAYGRGGFDRTDLGTFAALEDTLRETNRCANWLSERAWETKTFPPFKLQKPAYAETRERFPSLSSQIVIRAIAKVSDSYKRDRETKRTFRWDGSIAHDLRILRWYVEKRMVSIWTTSGRLKIPFVGGGRQYALLQQQQGESDLILHRGSFYLAATCHVDHPAPGDIEDVLGVDLGVNHIAADSDGNQYSGSHVKNVRHRNKKLRRKLQQKD